MGEGIISAHDKIVPPVYIPPNLKPETERLIEEIKAIEAEEKAANTNIPPNLSEDEVRRLMTSLNREKRKLALARIERVKRTERYANKHKIKDEEINELRHQNKYDALTGAYTRQHVLGREDQSGILMEMIKQASEEGHPLCIVMMDLNGFKQINDTYGHVAGDEALMKVVQILKAHCRPSDIVARYGGDEFMIILPNIRLQQVIEAINTRLVGNFSFINNEIDIPLSASFGICEINPDDEIGQMEFIHRADKALYQAKNLVKDSGGSNVVGYDLKKDNDRGEEIAEDPIT